MALSDPKQLLLQRKLARTGLKSEGSPAKPSLKRNNLSGPIPLSSAQRRMWFQAQIDSGAAYNFCIVIRSNEVMEGVEDLSCSRLQNALEIISERHQILQTLYSADATGVPQQVPGAAPSSSVTQHDLLSDDPNKELDEFARDMRDTPFDLTRDAPLRAALVHHKGACFAVVLTLPHIAGDGGSFATVLRDLEQVLSGGVLPQEDGTELRYVDYAIWEETQSKDGRLYQAQLDYWAETLGNLPYKVEPPLDFPRSDRPSFNGRQHRQWLEPEQSAALRAVAQARGVSKLVIMQTAVLSALSRAGMGDDICIGMPVDLRQDPGLAETVGFFSNTVAVRGDLSGNPTLTALLSRINTATLSALDHRDVPFEQVVSRIKPPRDPARTPLFDIMVTTSRPWADMSFAGRSWQVFEPVQTQAKFDLTFVIHDEGADGRIGLSLLYACDLFTSDNSADLLAMVTAVLGQMLNHPELHLSELANPTAQPLSPEMLRLMQALSGTKARQQHRRELALRPDVTEAHIAAAVGRLVSRHSALRLSWSSISGQWEFLDAAALFAKPIFTPQPPKDVNAEGRFCAWIDEAGHLILSAPEACVDTESWALILAELAELSQPGSKVTLPDAPQSYNQWLEKTAELAGSEELLDLAENWLDLLEPLTVPQSDRASTAAVHCVHAEIPLPELTNWPDPVALRTGSVAALLPLVRKPCRLDIDEPDRDRIGSSGFNSLVGYCRRVVPFRVVPMQQDSTFEVLLQEAQRLGVGEVTEGDVAVSYQLLRDVHPEGLGIFDGLAPAGMRLSVLVSDWGEGSDWEAEDLGSADAAAEHWVLKYCTRRKRARLILRGNLPDAELRARLKSWSEYLPDLLRAANAQAEGTCAEIENQVELTARDRRKLEEQFGTLRAVWPLSPLQEGLRFHAVGTAGAERDVYISQTRLSLSGPIDPSRLQSAINAAAAHVPNIAAGFAELDDQMVQVCPDLAEIPFQSVTVTSQDAAQAVADGEYHAEFDAAKPPLIRFALVQHGETSLEHDLYLTTHHILLDGWSIRLLFRLVFRLYDEPDCVALQPGIGRYFGWLSAQDSDLAEAPWHKVLADAQPTLLRPEAKDLEAQADQCEECEAHIEPATMALLTALARRASTTLSSVLELAWGCLLMRMSGSNDVIFGNVVSGRPAEIGGVDEIIGLMFNTIPVRIQTSGGETVLEALAALHKQKAVALPASHVGLSRLLQISGHSALFDTLFAVQNLPDMGQEYGSDIRFGDATVRDATHYPLSMAVSPGQSGIVLRLMFRKDLVSSTEAKALLRAYQELTAELAMAPETPLLQVDGLTHCPELLPQSDTGETLDYGTASVSDLLIEQAAKTPDLRAVVAGDVELSFAELAGQSNQLAHLLQARGVQPEHSVALLLPRSEAMIIALFGVFAAHAAYVPIDAETPAKRIESILDQAEPTVILTTGAMRDLLPDSYCSDYRIVEIDSTDTRENLVAQSLDRPTVNRPAGLDHLAYVIFTSGSTGQPKGVAVPYRGLTNMFVNHQKEIFAPTLAQQGGRRIRIAHTTSFAFDASWEQLLWLLSGHEVHVISDELRRDPDRLLPLFDTAEIDAFDVTPTYGAYLVEHGLLDRPRCQGKTGTGVIFVSLGGEAVGDALWTQLRDAPGVGGYNLYGPTEYTINALGADLADSAEPSVGRPISNTRAMILGPGLLPAPTGVTGELYLSGVGLARGYTQRPGQTAERFVAHPSGAPGERLYRTGDLARWRADGSIDFLGRADNQLKIRGYRIEPAEIENIIVALEGITRAAVIGRPSGAGGLQLVAYLVGSANAPDLKTLRDHLRRELPSYMVPAAFVYVDDLPRTINGKLNILALPEPETAESEDSTPSTEMERRICEAFAEVLDRNSIGRLDDFFDAGGHSLLTVRLAGLLRDNLAAEISLRQIYEHPTPAALAAALGDSGHRSDGDELPSADLLRQLEKDACCPEDLPIPAPAKPDLSGARPVLLTGAGGFLGCHILDELLRRTPVTVECLVRAKNDQAAFDRIKGALQSYGLWQPDYAPRIIGRAGDLSQPQLGLGAKSFAACADRYGVILHNAGATNASAPYTQLKPTNVDGAEQILRLAAQGRTATPVHFVSTASVISSEGENPAVITEDTRLSAADVEPNGYVQSKWVAEEMMHGAAAAGLPIVVHRPGRVSGHTQSGAGSPGLGFWIFIRAMLQLEAAPILRTDQITMVPVDYVAQALVALVDRGEPGATYHLSNRSRTSVSAIVAAAERAGYKLDKMPLDDWFKRLEVEAQRRADAGDNSMTSALLLKGHMVKYDGPIAESDLGQSQVEAALAGSGIAPPAITAEILDRYIAYFRKSGFFPEPAMTV